MPVLSDEASSKAFPTTGHPYLINVSHDLEASCKPLCPDFLVDHFPMLAVFFRILMGDQEVFEAT